jgi:hypothetical protein
MSQRKFNKTSLSFFVDEILLLTGNNASSANDSQIKAQGHESFLILKLNLLIK